MILVAILSRFTGANLTIAREMGTDGPSLVFGLNARYNLMAFLGCASVVAMIALLE